MIVLALSRQRRPSTIMQIGLLALLAGVISIPAITVYGVWAGVQAMKALWAIQGPPCPVVAAPSRMVQGRRPPTSFHYGGAEFAHQVGGATCVAIPEDGLFRRQSYHKCQFNGPAMVAVTVGGHKTIYEPGVGRTVTITVRRGRPACVMGGWYKI